VQWNGLPLKPDLLQWEDLLFPDPDVLRDDLLCKRQVLQWDDLLYLKPDVQQ
jgi:hypothetical protein